MKDAHKEADSKIIFHVDFFCKDVSQTVYRSDTDIFIVWFIVFHRMVGYCYQIEEHDSLDHYVRT